MIYVSADDRVSFRSVPVFINGRLLNPDKVLRRWSMVSRHRMKTLHVAPLKIRRLLQNIHLFPRVLSDVANPKASCRPIQCHAMRIAQSNGPEFLKHTTFRVLKWI